MERLAPGEQYTLGSEESFLRLESLIWEKEPDHVFMIFGIPTAFMHWLN
jgi:hypothetical protein